MKAQVSAFNQEKALVGAFSVIVQPVVEPMEHYTALSLYPRLPPAVWRPRWRWRRCSCAGSRHTTQLPQRLSMLAAHLSSTRPGEDRVL